MSTSNRNLISLRQMIDAYQISQVIGVAAKLGLADLLAEHPRSPEELANRLNIDPGATKRFLLTLESIGIIETLEDDRFQLTEFGAFLKHDHPESVRAKTMHAIQPAMWTAWGNLETSLRTGQPAFPQTHDLNVWEYRDRNPEAGSLFDAAMAESREVAASIAHAYDFSQAHTVVDIGGGTGTLLTEILTLNPSLTGVLFEQPNTCDRARLTLAETAIANRCAIIPGNFFSSIPASGDIYILKGVLHDWSDDRAREILTVCHRDMLTGSKLLCIEQVAVESASPFTRFMDLHMLVIHGGKERTLAEFKSLLTSTGFQIKRITPTDTGLTIIEAAP